MTALPAPFGEPDPPFPAIVYPLCHAAIGFGYLLALILRVLPLGRYWFALGLWGFLWIVLVKEAWWDPKHEGLTQPFFWAGAWDLACYLIGLAVGAAVILV